MRKFMAVILTIAMLFTSAVYAGPEQPVSNSNSCMPPNEEGIAKLLIKQGVLDAGSSQDEVLEAVKSYVNKKMKPDPNASFEKKQMFEKAKEAAEQAGSLEDIDFKQMVRGYKFGKVSDLFGGFLYKDWTVEEQEYTGDVREIKLLVLLAEFSDDSYGDGPLHNEIAKPGPQNNTDMWVENFSKEHYQGMLFTEGGYDAVDQNGEPLHLDSMTDYYLEQSCGSFRVDGDVYGWYQLPYSEAYYGDDASTGGHDNSLPGTSHDLVADLMKVAYESGEIPFKDYDVEDAFDLDGDGNYDEPDGIIDHLVIVHAGVDQSGGGGAQGDDAIWAHSSSVMERIPIENPTVPYWGNNMLAYNYTIQGEDGTIGVFCHETGHDLGLPDEYDTIYSGNGDSVGFYSLMSSGSWVGKPLGSKPTPISPWGRIELGRIWGGQWVQPTEINYNQIKPIGKTYKLDETTTWGNNNQVIKVNLPEKKKITVEPYEGEYSFFGGKGDELDNRMTTAITLPDAANITLNFKTWYRIEDNWDFGFVQVSDDNGETWKPLVSERMSWDIDGSGMESIAANLPGYTGSSDGWVEESIDMSEYAGQDILLGFRYMTDWGTSFEGFYIDDVSVVADESAVFQDNGENGEEEWNVSGWMLSKGYEMKDHYYLLEWRNYNNTDASLKYCYNYTNLDKGIAEYFRYEPGMLMWYRDTAYDDNWTAEHPGYGFLSVIDSHASPILVNRMPVRTRIQTHDASFKLEAVPSKVLTLSGKRTQVGNSMPVPTFDDSKPYWYEKAPDAGVIVPKYGIKIMVQRRAEDYTVGEIRIFK